MHPFLAPMVGLGIMALLLAKASDGYHFPPLWYKIFVGNSMHPGNLCPNHPNLDKGTGRISEKQANFGHCPPNCNQKKT